MFLGIIFLGICVFVNIFITVSFHKYWFLSLNLNEDKDIDLYNYLYGFVLQFYRIILQKSFVYNTNLETNISSNFQLENCFQKVSNFVF